ncbi:glycosyltransferase family 2 protein [Carboxylicivirga linearis]|uniref:Glycosyltransferase family 2 protein n=1 Tax=Carboxylicivirga linearis TaxID=1628157 RepID=A0ABS5JUH7_9BACT|nr:glycosyltransferase family 2 protein [Carboxylicivirga linearis]MBS2098550.1 glycosyltransferase family 2 protein [Carboxylicivirga linearis]
MNSLFTIIVSYNFEKWIDKCLGSFASSTMLSQIIVVDNNSTDNTVSIIKENYPEVILIENKKNLGFGQANNLGIKYAIDHNAEFVFLLNQDAWIQANTFEKMVSAYQSLNDQSIGLLSPVHLDSKDNIEKGFLNYISKNHKLLNDLFLNKKKNHYTIDFVNAAAIMLSVECLKTVGGFEPEFFHYGEDVNFFQRIKFHNFKAVLIPDAFITHARDLENKERKTSLQRTFYFEFMETYKFDALDVNQHKTFRKKYLKYLRISIQNLFRNLVWFNKTKLIYWFWYGKAVITTRKKYAEIQNNYITHKGIYL